MTPIDNLMPQYTEDEDITFTSSQLNTLLLAAYNLGREETKQDFLILESLNRVK